MNLNLPEILGHRGLFHTPFFALLFLIPGIILLFTKKREYSTYLFIIAWGIILAYLITEIKGLKNTIGEGKQNA